MAGDTESAPRPTAADLLEGQPRVQRRQLIGRQTGQGTPEAVQRQGQQRIQALGFVSFRARWCQGSFHSRARSQVSKSGADLRGMYAKYLVSIWTQYSIYCRLCR